MKALTRALSIAALVVSALVGRSAEAQVIVHDRNRFRSPQHWAIELRFGPYAPEIDSEFEGAENPPHRRYFGDKARVMPQLELDYQFLHVFGSLAVGAQVGYLRESAKAFNVAGTARSSDTTALTLIPMAVQLVYRMDEAARRLDIPIAPYAKAGLSYTLWTISDSNGDVAREGGGRGRGGTPGWQASVGVALLLDFIDPAAARALDSETGVNHTYVFVEAARFEASGLGRKKALKVGDTTWFVGLMFEF